MIDGKSVYQYLQDCEHQCHVRNGGITHQDIEILLANLNLHYENIRFDLPRSVVRPRLEEIVRNEELPCFGDFDWILQMIDENSTNVWVTTEEQAIQLKLIL